MLHVISYTISLVCLPKEDLKRTLPKEEKHAAFILCWLPAILAERIGNNHGDWLGIPARSHADQWHHNANYAICDSENNLVYGKEGHLRTFGAIQWECELYNGQQKAGCYLYYLPKHLFWKHKPHKPE